MKRLALAMALAVGCTTQEAPKPATEPAPKPAVAPSASGKVFGAKIDSSTPFVPLEKLGEDPKAWDGKRVRTRGEIIAVCQAAGCWADLRPVGATAGYLPTHVTMHDHAFFLPKDSKSKVVEVEGTLTARALSKSEVEHYNSEGASLTAGQTILNVDALGVLLP